jgi:hypothetical protein
MGTMLGALLPGNSTAELREFDIPVPGHGEVLIRMKSSTICGSDIRCIYHEHLGKGPEARHDRRTRAVWSDRGDWAGLPALPQRRSRNRLSHIRMRRLQRLQARLHDFLHERIPARIRLAAGWRHGGVPAGRGEGSCPFAG